MQSCIKSEIYLNFIVYLLLYIISAKEIRSKDHKGKTMYLEDYNIGNLSNLYIVLRLLGGSLPQSMEVHVESEEMEIETESEETESEETESEMESEESESEETESEETESEECEIVPKLYDSEVQLTDKPDMFTLDDEKDGQRAEMPCGHAISMLF